MGLASPAHDAAPVEYLAGAADCSSLGEPARPQSDPASALSGASNASNQDGSLDAACDAKSETLDTPKTEGPASVLHQSKARAKLRALPNGEALLRRVQARASASARSQDGAVVVDNG